MTSTPSSTALAQDATARTLALGRETLNIEAQAVHQLVDRVGPAFVAAVQAMLRVQGRVVVMGMGKSGHVGRKTAATLASTGTPALFVHPAEASHGDLGMVKDVDLVLAISNSGESAELDAILPTLKRQGVRAQHDACDQIAQHGRQLEQPKHHHRQHGGQQVQQGNIQRGHASNRNGKRIFSADEGHG